MQRHGASLRGIQRKLINLADEIDAEVLAEAAVFDGDEGGGHIVGQFVQGHGLAAGLAAVGDQLAVGRDDADIGRPIGHLPRVGGGELGVEIEHDGTEGELYSLTDDPLQQVNRWDDPSVRALRDDLVSSLWDEQPPEHDPRLQLQAPV